MAIPAIPIIAGKAVGAAGSLGKLLTGMFAGGGIAKTISNLFLMSMLYKGVSDPIRHSAERKMSKEERDHAMKLLGLQNEKELDTTLRMLQMVDRQSMRDRQFRKEDVKEDRDFAMRMADREDARHFRDTQMALATNPQLNTENLSPTNVSRLWQESILRGR